MFTMKSNQEIVKYLPPSSKNKLIEKEFILSFDRVTNHNVVSDIKKSI